MPKQSTRVDALFQALANPTRRAVVESLSRGPASVSELAWPFDMALPSFLQHLRVLEESGLVQSTKVGRVRTAEIVPTAFEEIEGWMVAQRRLWNRRLDQLDAHLHAMKLRETDR